MPIVLIGACVAYHIIKRRTVKDTSTESWQYKAELDHSMAPLKAMPASVGGFSAYRNSDGAASDRSSSGSSTLGGMKKRRMYDRSYRTHEPLPGKPPVDFDDKLWDLGQKEEGGNVHTSLTLSDAAPSVYRHSRQTDIY